jgi:pilus biogenesis lipoprotein CpaD
MITPVFIPRRGRSTAWGWLWATALTAGLQACADGPSPPKTDFASGTANPIQISRTQIAHSVPFPQSGSEPDAGQMSALFAFIAANGVGPKDTVLIEHGGELRDQAHAETLASRLSSIGLRPRIVNNTRVAAGVERVVVERYVAIAPNCPDWSQKPSPNYQNDNQRNFGCADAANLAAMVADPKDLAMGASLGAQLGDPVTKPVADYRTGTPAGDGLGASGKAPAGGAGASSGGGAGSGAPSATGP